MKKARGCHTTGTNVTLLGSEKLDRCPLIFVRDHAYEFNKLLGIWSLMQKGFLPESGGVDDQQAQVMNAVMICDRAIAEAKAEMRKGGKRTDEGDTPKGGAGKGRASRRR